MNKLIKQFFSLICLIGLLVLPYFVFAGSAMQNNLESVGEGSGFAEANETTLSSTAGQIVGILLGFLGIVFVILIIYAGFKWMTAAGNEDKVKEARSTITRATIGLIIVIGAWAIWAFILYRIF